MSQLRCLSFNVNYEPDKLLGSGFFGGIYSIKKNGEYVMKIVRILPTGTDLFTLYQDARDKHKTQQQLDKFKKEVDRCVEKIKTLYEFDLAPLLAGKQESYDVTRFKEEIRLQTKAADAGLAPKIIESWTCPDNITDYGYGVIVSERLEQTVYEYVKTHQDALDALKILEGVHKAFHKLNNILQIIHGDGSMSNFMLGKSKKAVRLELSIGTRYLSFIDFGEARDRKDSADAEPIITFSEMINEMIRLISKKF